jgi:DNA-binding transcriptional LysR family regulator
VSKWLAALEAELGAQLIERTTRPVCGRFAANNSEALLMMARSGLGVALLASWLVDADVRAGRLVARLPEYELPGAPVQAPVQALLPPGRHTHPRVRAFLDHMAEALAADIG